jgi:N-acyl homoserine lactone hydrolase
MTAPRLDVLIQPLVLRFSIQEDEIVYHFAGGADMQLDRMEHLMGIDPTRTALFDSNLGFLPISTAVLIRGERTIVFDPGNHHTGFYGQLGMSLKCFGLGFEDVDMVVSSHCHHDHMASVKHFRGAELVMGEGELDFARSAYGRLTTEAIIEELHPTEPVPLHGSLELMHGVTAVSTPGHTPGHISLLVDDERGERVLLTGDAAMTRSEFEDGAFSHWYQGEQLAQVRASGERMRSAGATLVMPGHDRAFRPSGGARS